MRKWVGGLVILPYIVGVTTATFGQPPTQTQEYQYTALYREKGKDDLEIPCGNNIVTCGDFVEMMNNSHRLREASQRIDSDVQKARKP